MNRIKLNIAIIGLLSLIGSSLYCYSQDSIDITIGQAREIDICSNDPLRRMALFMINLGQINSQDSLFGYDFEIQLNPDKFKFENGIYIGTLSEAFNSETRDTRAGDIPGTVRGYGVHLYPTTPPVTGNKPLVGVLCQYKLNYPDTTLVRINYIEFTSEFKKIVRTLKDTVIYVNYLDKPNRFLSAKLIGEELYINNDNATLELAFNAGKETKVSKINFDLTTEKSNFIIENVKGLSPDVSNLSTAPIENGLNIDFDISNLDLDKKLIGIELQRTDKTDSVCTVRLSNISTNINSCVGRYEADSFSYTVRDTIADTVSVKELESNSKLSASIKNDELILESEKILLMDASFFDLTGLLLKHIDIKGSKRFIGTVSDLPTGVYLLAISGLDEQQKEVKNKSLIIKY